MLTQWSVQRCGLGREENRNQHIARAITQSHVKQLCCPRGLALVQTPVLTCAEYAMTYKTFTTSQLMNSNARMQRSQVILTVFVRCCYPYVLAVEGRGPLKRSHVNKTCACMYLLSRHAFSIPDVASPAGAVDAASCGD